MMTHLPERIRRTAAGLRLSLGLVLLSFVAGSPLSAVASAPAAHGGAVLRIGSETNLFNVVEDAKGNLFYTVYGSPSAPSFTIKEVVATSGIITPNSQVVDAASVSDPSGLAIAPNGDLLVIHQGFNGAPSSIYRVAATNGSIAPNSTGVLVNTIPGLPVGIAVDRNGNVFVASDGTIYEIVASGGSVSSASTINKVFTNFKAILGLAFAPNGDLAVTDTGASSLDVIRATAGTISAASSVVTINSNLIDVTSVAIDRQGNIYTGDPDNNAVHEFLAVNGAVGAGATERTTAVPECNNAVQGLLVDGDENLYIASDGSGLFELQGTVQRLPPVAVGSTGTAQRIYLTFDSSGYAGDFTISESGDTAEDLDFVRSSTQPSNACQGDVSFMKGDVCAVDVIFTPKSPGVHQAAVQIRGYLNEVIGTAFLSAVGTGPVPQFVPGTLTLFAGAAGSNGYISGMPGPATSVNLGQNEIIRLDASGNAYVADHDSDVLFEIDANTGYAHIVAGQLQNGDTTGDGGPASSATLNAPAGLAIDGAGNIYLSQQNLNSAATTFTNTVRRIDAVTGIITTVAGNLTRGYSGDGGPATSAAMNFPGALALDAAGNLFIADEVNCAVRRVDAVTGIITTYAGNGSCGYSGDGGAGPAAQLSSVNDLAFDSAGNLYIADGNNGVVREVNAATGIISTVDGTSSHGSLQDGVAIGQAYMGAQALAFDAADNLYAGLGEPYIVRAEKVNQIVRHLAGGGSGDQVFGAPAVDHSIIGAYSVALDGAGNLYFVDGRQIAKITAASPTLTFKTATKVGSLDSTDDPQKAILANIGNTPLVFAAASTGTNPNISPANWVFDASNTCPITSAGGTATSLSAGQECIAAVDFQPQAPGPLTGNIVFADNALNATAATQSIALNGTGIGAALTIAPTSIAFPSTTAGSASASMTATISNSSASAVYLSKGSLTDATDFTQSDNCGGIVVAAASCTVTFTFTPKSAVPLSSTYSIADLNNLSSPLTVALFGTGTAPYGLTVAPTSITFPATVVGATSGAMTATLTLNGGSTRVNLTSGSLTDSTDFTQSDNCGGSITPNGSCTITFIFTPKAAGTLSSTYSIGLQNGTPVTVSLTGNGTGTASATLTPSSSDFGTIIAGGSTAATVFTLTNTGNLPLNIMSVTLAGANASSFNIAASTCGPSLAVGGACTASVAFVPMAAGTFTASLSVVDTAGTQVSTLTGTATSAIPPDFTISATPATQSAYHGGSVSYTVQLASLVPSNPYTNAVVLSVTGLPAGATASFSPASVMPGTGQPTSQLTIGIPTLSSMDLRTGATDIHLAVLLLGSIVFVLPRWRRKRGRRLTRLLPLLIAVLTLTTISTLSGCGTGNGFATPTGTYTLTITGTGNNSTHSTTVNLIVK